MRAPSSGEGCAPRVLPAKPAPVRAAPAAPPWPCSWARASALGLRPQPYGPGPPTPAASDRVRPSRPLVRLRRAGAPLAGWGFAPLAPSPSGRAPPTPTLRGRFRGTSVCAVGGRRGGRRTPPPSRAPRRVGGRGGPPKGGRVGAKPPAFPAARPVDGSTAGAVVGKSGPPAAAVHRRKPVPEGRPKAGRGLVQQPGGRGPPRGQGGGPPLGATSGQSPGVGIESRATLWLTGLRSKP